MASRAKIPHLRLVSEQSASSVSASSKMLVRPERHGKQLGLPFFDQYTLVFAEVSLTDAQNFRELIGSISPKWIFDIRVNPRLDRLGGSRKEVFDSFAARNIKYIDLFGHLSLSLDRSANMNPTFWSNIVGEILKNSSAPFGPFLFLSDDLSMIEAADPILKRDIELHLRRKISVEIVIA